MLALSGFWWLLIYDKTNKQVVNEFYKKKELSDTLETLVVERVSQVADM